MDAVEGYLLDQTGEEAAIMKELHQWFLTFPGVEARLKFGIPFFYRKSWICYLNPQKKGGIELVFLKAKQLDDPESQLKSRGRKMVVGMYLQKRNEIPYEYLEFLFNQAVLVDLE